MILGDWHRSTWLTYAGAAISVAGMGLAASRQLSWAVGCLVLAGLADLFDGPVARSMTRTSAQRAFGVQLDSLADVVSFIAFPVVLIHALAGVWWSLPALVWYAVAGLARLAIFNVAAAEDDTPVSHYRGLPVTYAALIFGLAAFARAPLGEVFPAFLVALTVVVGGLFIADLPVPKPRGVAYLLFGSLAIGVLAALVVVGV